MQHVVSLRAQAAVRRTFRRYTTWAVVAWEAGWLSMRSHVVPFILLVVCDRRCVDWVLLLGLVCGGGGSLSNALLRFWAHV
jgi:hypothetical protein